MGLILITTSALGIQSKEQEKEEVQHNPASALKIMEIN